MIIRAFKTLTWATFATAIGSAMLLANLDAQIGRLFGAPTSAGAPVVRSGADAASVRRHDDAPRAASSGRTLRR